MNQRPSGYEPRLAMDPLRRFQLVARCRPDVAVRKATSHEDHAALQSVVCAELPAHQVHRAPLDVHVSVPPAGVSLPHRPPETFAAGFILSCAFVPLQSLSSYGRLTSPDVERLPWGLVPLRDIDRRSPQAARDPTPSLRSALGVSHALDGFLLHRLCGFVSPRSHVRDSLSRGFPLHAAVRLSSPLPSCRLARPSYRRCRRRQKNVPRLQGVTPRGDPSRRIGD